MEFSQSTAICVFVFFTAVYSAPPSLSFFHGSPPQVSSSVGSRSLGGLFGSSPMQSDPLAQLAGSLGAALGGSSSGSSLGSSLLGGSLGGGSLGGSTLGSTNNFGGSTLGSSNFGGSTSGGGGFDAPQANSFQFGGGFPGTPSPTSFQAQPVMLPQRRQYLNPFDVTDMTSCSQYPQYPMPHVLLPFPPPSYPTFPTFPTFPSPPSPPMYPTYPSAPSAPSQFPEFPSDYSGPAQLDTTSSGPQLISTKTIMSPPVTYNSPPVTYSSGPQSFGGGSGFMQFRNLPSEASPSMDSSSSSARLASFLGEANTQATSAPSLRMATYGGQEMLGSSSPFQRRSKEPSPSPQDKFVSPSRDLFSRQLESGVELQTQKPQA